MVHTLCSVNTYGVQTPTSGDLFTPDLASQTAAYLVLVGTRGGEGGRGTWSRDMEGKRHARGSAV